MYRIWIGDLALPVAPPKMETAISNQNKTVSLMNEGEVAILKLPGLTDIRFTAPFPQDRYPWGGGVDVSAVLAKLERMKTRKKPVPFVVSRPRSWHTAMQVSLEDYKVTEDADNGRTIEIDIHLKQYRPYGTKTATVKSRETSPDGKETVKVLETRTRESMREDRSAATAREGDSLSELLRRETGTDAQVRDIAKRNGITDPNRLQEGQVIRLA